MIGALGEAALGFRIRNSRYRSITDVSDNLATRDLKELVDAGLLIAKGEKRGRWYEGSDYLRAIEKKFREDGAIPDPFESIGQGELF
jgi:DNA-binding transcriptional ArsR family regulator